MVLQTRIEKVIENLAPGIYTLVLDEKRINGESSNDTETKVLKVFFNYNEKNEFCYLPSTKPKDADYFVKKLISHEVFVSKFIKYAEKEGISDLASIDCFKIASTIEEYYFNRKNSPTEEDILFSLDLLNIYPDGILKINGTTKKGRLNGPTFIIKHDNQIDKISRKDENNQMHLTTMTSQSIMSEINLKYGGQFIIKKIY